MSERVCPCGNKLSSMNRSLRCYKCKEKDAYEKRRQAGQKQLDEAKAAGRVRLHSCISNAFHDPMPTACSCRKFVTFDQAREFIRTGRCVDFQTRSSNLFDRAIVERSRLKSMPVSTLGQRIAIERKTVEFDEKEIARMKAAVEEHKILRIQEQSCKIDIEHDLAIEEQNKLIVLVDEETFDEMKARSWGRPGIFNRIEERTSVGVDVLSLEALKEAA
jgi:hypothetical protein